MDSGIFSFNTIKNTHNLVSRSSRIIHQKSAGSSKLLFFSLAVRSASCSSYTILQPELLIKQYTNTASLYYRQAFVIVQLWPQLNLKAILLA